jgi:nitronate monooxygenase
MEEKIHELRGYYAELSIEAPSTVEARYQDFEAQAHAAIDARPAVLSFVYGIPPAEILDECRRQKIRTIGTATTPEEAITLEQAGLELIVASGFEGGVTAAHFFVPQGTLLWEAFRSFLRWWMLFQFQ